MATPAISESEDGEPWIFGITPVLALLADPGRGVEGVLVNREARSGRIQEAIDLARGRGVKLRFVDRVQLDRLTRGGVHQGVAARAGVRPQPDWEELLDRVMGTAESVLVLLDGVVDERNLGAVIRSAEAFGAMAVVVPKDRSAPLSPVAEKAAAGAASMLDVVRVTNLSRAIVALRECGVRVYGFAAEAGIAPEAIDWRGPVALVFGGEEVGIRRLVREKCDGLLSIPLVGRTSSLNVAVAAGIGLYAVTRGRGNQAEQDAPSVQAAGGDDPPQAPAILRIPW